MTFRSTLWSRQLKRQDVWLRAGGPGFDPGWRRVIICLHSFVSILVLESIQPPINEYRGFPRVKRPSVGLTTLSLPSAVACEFVNLCFHIPPWAFTVCNVNNFTFYQMVVFIVFIYFYIFYLQPNPFKILIAYKQSNHMTSYSIQLSQIDALLCKPLSSIRKNRLCYAY